MVKNNSLKWASAIEIIDDDLFVGAESDKNLHVLYKYRYFQLLNYRYVFMELIELY